MASSSITLITTGGTIGSSIESESVNVTQGQQQLQLHVQDICQHNKITLKTRAVFNKNSEDLTPSDWLSLINAISDEIDSGCDKIIITHGTDTMAYTAVAIALCFRKRPLKIVLTGSCFTLDHPESDVTANLLGAFTTIAEATINNGVYVSFLNADKQTEVFDALDIKPMAYDELAFRAAFNQALGVFGAQQNNYQAHPRSNQPHPLEFTVNPAEITTQAVEASGQRVVQISCYPGMNAVQLCAGLEAGSCVIINLYHSGTGPSLAEENSLLEVIQLRADLTFLLTPLPSRYITKPYSATVTLMRAGAHLFQDIQPHALYVLMVLGFSSGWSLQQLLAELKPHLQPMPTP